MIRQLKIILFITLLFASHANAAAERKEDPMEVFNELLLYAPADQIKQAMKDIPNLKVLSARSNVTPLMIASMTNSDPKVIRLITETGVDINQRDLSGKTALAHAVSSNQNPEVAQALIEAGAKVDARIGNSTYLILALKDNPGTNVYKLFLNKKIDVNHRDDEGKTALMYGAVSKRPLLITRDLLTAGANKRIVDMEKKTALDHFEESPMLKLLSPQAIAAIRTLLKP